MSATTRIRPLPVPTIVVLGVLAAVLWLNAAINHYLFNVAIALLGSLPVLIVLGFALIGRRPSPR